MTKPFRTLWASAALAMAVSVAMVSTAQATAFSMAGAAMEISAKKGKAAKKSKGGKISFNDGSAESRSERDRRLKRECKGRSNSGLCEGYTR
jgi:hypothetical protein